MASSQSQKFELFMDLPTELRQLIWFFAIPRRVISPRMTGDTFAPKPPPIASVCRDSRAAALHYGRPYHFDKYKKRPSSCWFTPSLDVVFLHDNHTRDILSHPMISKSLWEDVQTIVVQDKWANNRPKYRATLIHAVHMAAKNPQLKEILVWPVASQRYRGARSFAWIRPDGQWGESSDEFFGGEGMRIINFKDIEKSKAVEIAVKLGMDDSDKLALARNILWASRAYNQLLNQDGTDNHWDELVEECQRAWLTMKQKQSRIAKAGWGGNNPAHFPATTESITKLDLDNQWIRETLAKMPTIRPVILSAREDDSFMHNPPSEHGEPTRSTREHWDTEPRMTFNSEFKLWQKVEKY